MAEPILCAAGVVVPAEAQEVHAVRSSGPGGQNVNKVASKIDLRIDLSRIQGLDAASYTRLLRIAANRLDGAGRLQVTSQRTRDQHRNLEDAQEKVRALIERALVAEKPRHRTRPSSGSRERRLGTKRMRSQVKSARRRPTVED
jgi:ribosome-associated protein